MEVGAGDRARVETILADRNNSVSHVELGRTVLLTGDDVSMLSIMREVGCAKATV